MRILIADDHETVRKGIRMILMSRKDVEICGEAANGEEAIQKASELNPNLVVLDLSMPALGGLEAARRIRKTLPGVPILILTMHNSNGVAREAQLAGAQGFVTKTETAQVLLKAVDTLLKGETFFLRSDGNR
jgi:DNA-binding NarL/FixJ family response regulator